MAKSNDEIIEAVRSYYAKKIRDHGATPRGVDWNSEESQRVRFHELLQVCDFSSPFSLTEFGCGYGALAQYLAGLGADVRFEGFDISQDMISAARKHCEGLANCNFHVGLEPSQPADYCIASGLFNVRTDVADEPWLEHMCNIVGQLEAHSVRGFSFNCLSSYADADRQRPDLFYADPLYMFDYCKRVFSRHVALLHDYGLYEFTILVRKGI